jgi:hypothetical protein
VDELVERYRELQNIRQVARDFAISRTTVAKLLDTRGVDTSRGLKAGETEQAVELYTQGISSSAIGKLFAVDNHTVLNALRRAGVAVRPR